jgi:hypothetical protein
MRGKSTAIISKNKDIVSVFVMTAVILIAPLVAMLYTEEVKWTLFDFAVMGTLLVGTGLFVVLALRRVKNIKYRAAVIAILLAAFLLFWAELAVGIFGTPLSGS